MSFEMLNDNVLISSQQEDKRNSSIIIPESASKDNGSSIGVVEAVGPGAYDVSSGKIIPMKVKKGDKVYYRKWAGSDVKVTEGEKIVEYKVLQEKDIFAILVENK